MKERYCNLCLKYKAPTQLFAFKPWGAQFNATVCWACARIIAKKWKEEIDGPSDPQSIARAGHERRRGASAVVSDA